MRYRIIPALVVLALAGCGDKVPQSEAAKKLGNVPKQTIDKSAADVTRALEQGAKRNREADNK